MSDFKTGDHVKWVEDVDRIYSQFTKGFVGRIGKIVDTSISRPAGSTPKTNSPGCFDIQFPCDECESGGFIVWDICTEHLILMKWDYTAQHWFDPKSGKSEGLFSK